MGYAEQSEAPYQTQKKIENLEKEVERLKRYLSCPYYHDESLLRNCICTKCGWRESEFRGT